MGERRRSVNDELRIVIVNTVRIHASKPTKTVFNLKENCDV